MVSLLLLLMPLLLLTTSAQKRVGLEFKVTSAEGTVRPGLGPLENLDVHVAEDRIEIRALLRRTDVTASAGDTEERVIGLPNLSDGPDLVALQSALRELKRLDPTRERLALLPSETVSAGTVVAVLDAVRGDALGPLFASPLLGGTP